MMTEDDIKTLKAALLYIIEKSETKKRDVYGIVKTAFYAQQIHLSTSGSPLFKDDICALPFGPVPSVMYAILKLARGDERELQFHNNDALLRVSTSIGWKDEQFFAKEKPDLDYLSESDILALNLAIERVSKMSFDDIYSDTHGPEWDRAYHKGSGKKVMNTLKIAEEGGADASVLAYLKEYIELQKALG